MKTTHYPIGGRNAVPTKRPLARQTLHKNVGTFVSSLSYPAHKAGLDCRTPASSSGVPLFHPTPTTLNSHKPAQVHKRAPDEAGIQRVPATGKVGLEAAILQKVRNSLPRENQMRSSVVSGSESLVRGAEVLTW